MRDHQFALNMRICLDDVKNTHIFSKVVSTDCLYSQCTRVLTFESFCLFFYKKRPQALVNNSLAWRIQEHKDFLRWQERHLATYYVHASYSHPHPLEGTASPGQQLPAQRSAEMRRGRGRGGGGGESERGEAGGAHRAQRTTWHGQFFLPLSYSVCIQALPLEGAASAQARTPSTSTASRSIGEVTCMCVWGGGGGGGGGGRVL
jgi:hypothetical protein